MYQRILEPFDGNPTFRRGLEEAVQPAMLKGARLLREGRARAERADMPARTGLIGNIATDLADAVADQLKARAGVDAAAHRAPSCAG